MYRLLEVSEISGYRYENGPSFWNWTKTSENRCPKPVNTVQERTQVSESGRKSAIFFGWSVRSRTVLFKNRRDLPQTEASVRNQMVSSKNIQFSETRSTKSLLQEDIVSLRLLASVSACFHVIWDSCALFSSPQNKRNFVWQAEASAWRARSASRAREEQFALTSRMPPFAYKTDENKPVLQAIKRAQVSEIRWKRTQVCGNGRCRPEVERYPPKIKL